MSEPAHKPTPLDAHHRDGDAARRVDHVGRQGEGRTRFRPDVEGGRVYAAAADGIVTVLDEDIGPPGLAQSTPRRSSPGGVEVAEGRVVRRHA